MTIQIKKDDIKAHILFVRVKPELYNQIAVLEKKHKVDRSTIIRKLLELGLEQLTK